jgi:hypothetical protein
VSVDYELLFECSTVQCRQGGTGSYSQYQPVRLLIKHHVVNLLRLFIFMVIHNHSVLACACVCEMCRPLQTTAASFQADAPPPSTFTLNGVDYSAAGLAKLRAEAQQEAAALMGVKLPAREWRWGCVGSRGGGQSALFSVSIKVRL